jgi:sugar/nucleoside kinase (ribokinase family)
MTVEPRLDLITLGEGLVEFGARTRGPLRRVRSYDAAGDAFCAAVLTGLTRGWPAEVTLQRACLVGSIVCGVAGDNDGIPTIDELERIASNRWVYR